MKKAPTAPQKRIRHRLAGGPSAAPKKGTPEAVRQPKRPPEIVSPRLVLSEDDIFAALRRIVGTEQRDDRATMAGYNEDRMGAVNKTEGPYLTDKAPAVPLLTGNVGAVHESISNLEGMLNELTDRLDPVLKPEPENLKGQGVDAPCPQPQIPSRVSDELQAASRRVIRVCARVQDLLRRLDY